MVAHPHPLHGGTMFNKVVHRAALALRRSGVSTLRFQFRGVGRSAGVHDDGRGELDDSQEINYPPVIRAIIETGYKGFIAQEFIPTKDDPVASLQQAFEVCDV